MSGGSFDYLYCQDANRLLVSDQLRAMQETLAGMHPQSQAAIRTSALLSRCTEFLEYLEAEQQALAGVWHAVEWRVSGDYGDDQVAAAVAKLEPMLKLPIEWATERGYVIGDPDGWRGRWPWFGGPEVSGSGYTRATLIYSNADPDAPVHVITPADLASTAFTPTHMMIGDQVFEKRDGEWAEIGRGAVSLVLDQDGGRMVLTEEQGESTP